jgi:stage III sporulation protein AH
MKFLKRKQIIVLSLVLMLVIAGYLQYSYNKSSQFSEQDSAQIGDAVYVDNQNMAAADATSVQADKKVADKAATASKEANSFFAQAKMDRDVVRGKDTEALKGITEDKLASKDAKSKAYEKMMKIVETSQKEMRIETLIKEKGFSDVVALISETGNVDVIVKIPAVSKADAAKIADIVMRQGSVSLDKIVIKPMF